MKHIILFFFLFTALHATDYFVSPFGDNTAGGTMDKPFLTIQKAADVMQPGDVCHIRKGIYRETIRPPRSGTTAHPLRFQAFQNEEVTITGTDRLNGSEWRSFSNGIYAANLSSLNAVIQVFADWQQMDIARFPNNTSQDLLFPTLGEADSAVARQTPALSELYDNALQGSVDWTGADLWLLSGLQWVAVITTIEEHNGDGITFKAPLGMEEAYNPVKGSRYFITGTLDALDAAREWFYDRESKELYFKAPGDVHPSTLDIDVRTRQWGFDLSSRANIQVEGIKFFAANVTMDLASNCLLTDSRIFYPVPYYNADAWSTTESPQNGNGAGVKLGGTYNTISNCEIAYSWGDGVTIYGEANTLDNCLVHDVGWTCADAAAVHTSGRDHVITHNSLFNAARSGLVHRKSQNLEIAYNDIYHCGLMCTDLGATYCYQTDGEGTVIHHNWVHDIKTRAHTAGIYIDNNSSNFIVHHNVVWNTDDLGIQTNLDAFNHQLYNNTIWNCSSAMGGGGGNEQLVDQIVYNNLSNSNSWFGTDVRQNLALSDAKFVDAGNGDFRLREDSPARDDYVIPVMLMNGGFENGTSGWNGAGCDLVTITDPVNTGDYAVRAYNRHYYWEGVRQTITDILKKHGKGAYTLEAWVKLPDGTGKLTGYLRMKFVDGAGEHYPGTTVLCSDAKWTKITAKSTISWTGELQEAVFELMTTDSDKNLPDLYIDDCAVIAPEISGGDPGQVGGILIPGITDDVVDGKPDAGAYEYGGSNADWKAGSNLDPEDPFVTSVQDKTAHYPMAFTLSQNFPNPFNLNTSIQYQLAQKTRVALTVYNMLGQRVKVLADGDRSEGIHTVNWDGTDEMNTIAPSGIYFVRMEAITGNRSVSLAKKIVLMK
jgi:hypothetical protein